MACLSSSSAICNVFVFLSCDFNPHLSSVFLCLFHLLLGTLTLRLHLLHKQLSVQFAESATVQTSTCREASTQCRFIAAVISITCCVRHAGNTCLIKYAAGFCTLWFPWSCCWMNMNIIWKVKLYYLSQSILQLQKERINIDKKSSKITAASRAWGNKSLLIIFTL